MALLIVVSGADSSAPESESVFNYENNQRQSGAEAENDECNWEVIQL